MTGTPLAAFSRSKLGVGIALYLTAAIIDAQMTLTGMGGVLELERNLVMRAMMRWLGPEVGLLVQKAAIGGVLILIAVYGERAIRDREPWIWRIASTEWERDWMQRKDRSWIAYVPLYMVAIAQGVAAGIWTMVEILSR